MKALKPADFANVVSDVNLISNMLSNKEAKSLWNEAVEKLKKVSSAEAKLLSAVVSNPKALTKIDPELLATGLASYVDVLLSTWKIQSFYAANALAASQPFFVKLSKHIPEIKPNAQYTAAYRGTSADERAIKEFIAKNSDPKNWQKTGIRSSSKLGLVRGGQNVHYRAYVGPKKNQFLYKPNRPVQSWSVSPNIASGFNTHMVAAPIDKSFYFDPEFMAAYGPSRHEKEVVHFGNAPMKVLLLVREEMFPFSSMPKDDDRIKRAKFTGLQEDAYDDDEGTLIIPQT